MTSRVERAAIALVAHRRAVSAIRKRVKCCDHENSFHGSCWRARKPMTDTDVPMFSQRPVTLRDEGLEQFVEDAEAEGWCQNCISNLAVFDELRDVTPRGSGLFTALRCAVDAVTKEQDQ